MSPCAQDYPLLLWRPENQRPKCQWYIIQQEIVDIFVACDQRFNSILPLALTHPSPKQFSEEDTKSFKSRGWHSHHKQKFAFRDKIG